MMKKYFSIIKNSWKRVIFGGILVVFSWIIFALNVRFSSEFVGGVKVTLDKNVEVNTLKEELGAFLESQDYKKVQIQANNYKNNADIVIKMKVENEAEKVKNISTLLKTFLVEHGYVDNEDQILAIAVTSPSIGAQTQKTAVTALIVGLLLMAVYMLFSFASIREYISPAILAFVTIVTMIFDISIPTGAYGLWMMMNKTIAVDVVFVIAILTTMGYSINDTIIIFDRIRENFKKEKSKNARFEKVFEESLWQTMRRSIGTSVSTLLVVLMMFILGTGSLKTFAFTIGVGIIAGTYSSIFIAAPLAYLMLGKYKKEFSKNKK